MTKFARRAFGLGVSIAALSALSFADLAIAGPDPCTKAGGVVTCSGDQTNGVSYINDATVVEIDVSNLIKAMKPATGVPGVDLQRHGAPSPALTVKADMTMTLVTDSAPGVHVSGTGDDGGDGHDGTAIITDANGGDASSGGAGSAITVTNSGSVTTTSGNAIDAFSHGGNGGQGGDAVFVLGSPAGSGGKGGDGGVGGLITITNHGALNTTGDGALGISAVSQSGDGGKAGASNTSSTAGKAGQGGSIVIVNDGTIATHGTPATLLNGAVGIFAKSTTGNGADGANGGDAGGDSAITGTIAITNSGVINTSGGAAFGIFADTMGGDGGNGHSGSGFIGTGGAGGAGGAAGDVTITNSGAITTTGTGAVGVDVQTLGGDGGAGALGSGAGAVGGFGGRGGHSGAIDVEVLTTGTVTTSGDNADAIFAGSLGGTGGPGGNAAALIGSAGGGGLGGVAAPVTVNNAGTLTTSGQFAYGIYAFSLGGKGGGSGTAGGAITFGGGSGSGSHGGDVSVSNSGTINTSGKGSYAIFAQSLGGAGGDAGANNGIIAIGGNGTTTEQAACTANPLFCNNAGTVTVVNSGTININYMPVAGDPNPETTTAAIFAESLGGGGGNGNASNGFINVGGEGGAGGSGGTVNVTNQGTITINADGTNAILAQNIGGGGGVAGDATAIGFSTQVSVGGIGGGGGNGGDITIVNSGTMITNGNDADVILAQSIGGGGGKGGDASVTALSLLPFAYGGGGGDGGNGGNINVTNSGIIEVAGDHSDGVFAQSIGGGGGDGGEAFTFGLSPVVNIAISVGGQGGQGGNAGSVTISNTNFIETFGDDSAAVFAQSIGGGGGDGGSSSATALSLSPNQAVAIAIAVGGKGRNGGTGGDVDVTNTQYLLTLGDDSDGIYAESVGGGGGVGADASASATAFGSKGSASISIGVGGGGGAGQNSGTVTVGNSGRIEAFGDYSDGIFAQSIGGGGGDGGAGTSDATEIAQRADLIVSKLQKVASIVLTRAGYLAKKTTQEKSGAKDVAVSLAIGGYGGGGGNGDTVSVTNSGSIETWGYEGFGIFGQSTGGGGGFGGGGSATTTKIPLSHGIEVGSGVGGQGGAAGDGGDVTITGTGTVTTHNDMADAIFGQSIGGGGGVAGFGSGSGSITSVDVTVGGQGGAAGNGGHVSINQTGNISTDGNLSFGIFGQSIGGGGGVGGAGHEDYSGKITVGGQGGSAGNGGAVDITFAGNITTQGAGAYGIAAQSIGGGGGMAGDISGQSIFGSPNTSGLISFVQDSASGGNGGIVTVNSTGTIVTTGGGAFGIMAQSVGGGGGIAGTSAASLINGQGSPGVLGFASVGFGTTGDIGQGGAVNVTHVGSILATGDASDAIFAQSVGCIVITSTTTCQTQSISAILGGATPSALTTLLGPGTVAAGGGNIALNLSGGTFEGGTGTGAGIVLNGGASNSITIAANASLFALGGTAINGSTPFSATTYLVNNSGVVTGNVLLTGGTQSAVFNNLSGATFRPNSVVNLGGPGGQLNNSGLLQPGGAGSGAIVALNGSLNEAAGSTYDIDVGFGLSATDRIDASGSATVGGTIVTHFTALMNQPENIVTSVGTMTSANPTSTFTSVVLHFSLDFSAHALTLTPVANWAPPGMTNHEEAVGHYFQAIWDAGGAVPLAADMGILAQISALPVYADALNHMTPAVYASAIAGEQSQSQDFTDNLMSCHGVSGAHSAIAEEDCSWSELSTGQRKQDGTIVADPSTYHDTRFQIGRQQHLTDDWLIGGALGYDNWHGTTDALGATSGQDFSAGLVAKHLDGNWLNAGALTVSFGNLGAERLLTIPAPVTVLGHTNTLVAGLRGRSAYLLDAGTLYFKPYADLDLDYYHMGGFDETGGGALDLHVKDVGKFAASLSPMLEAGADFLLSDTSFVRPYLLGGLAVSTGGTWAVSAGFDGAPSSIPDFTISEPTHQFMGRFGGGVELLNSNNVLLKIQYDSRIAGHYSSWNGLAKLGVEF